MRKAKRDIFFSLPVIDRFEKEKRQGVVTPHPHLLSHSRFSTAPFATTKELELVTGSTRQLKGGALTRGVVRTPGTARANDTPSLEVVFELFHLFPVHDLCVWETSIAADWGGGGGRERVCVLTRTSFTACSTLSTRGSLS